MDLWLEFTKLLKFLEKYGKDVFEIESMIERIGSKRDGNWIVIM